MAKVPPLLIVHVAGEPRINSNDLAAALGMTLNDEHERGFA